MPKRQKKICNRPGCYNVINPGQNFCFLHKRSKSNFQKMYNYRWDKARTIYLINNPLCVKCKEKGLIVPANVVDHIKPHQGNKQLFWDYDNWQALCTKCHNKKTSLELK